MDLLKFVNLSQYTPIVSAKGSSTLSERHSEGGYGWVFGGVLRWVLGWVSEKHPPFNFSLIIDVLSDLGGCWGF